MSGRSRWTGAARADGLPRPADTIAADPARPERPTRRRPVRRWLAASLVVLLVGCAGVQQGGPSPDGSRPVVGSGVGPALTPGISPPSTQTVVPLPTDAGDGAADVSVPVPGLSDSIELYAGVVSVIPGDMVPIHVSTTAPTFGIDILREGWQAGVRDGQVFSRDGIPGVDQRRFARRDPTTGLARAGWAVSLEVDTAGWTPGVYMIRGLDSRGHVGWAPFVVRTPSISAGEPLFVFTALTYQAYNAWGGGSFYSVPRATRVSFDRPYEANAGRETFDRADSKLLHWLEGRGYALQFTTDYDLAVDPPATAPSLLIVAMHMEYVPGTLRDWLDLHVNRLGDMNLAIFGANSVYWQARLAPATDPTQPHEIVCYKEARLDPLVGSAPYLATVRWREPPVDRPQGALLGAQYVGILGDGHTSRFDYVVDPSIPHELLVGTGWQPGQRIRGLLVGEGDALYPGVGSTSLMTGAASGNLGQPLQTTVTIRTSSVGARVFDAGSFQWADGFDATQSGLDIGVAQASFEQFNVNLLAWLGLPAR